MVSSASSEQVRKLTDRHQTSRLDNARFSTYSGAPSIQPSLAPTFESTASRGTVQRQSDTYPYLDTVLPIDEKLSAASAMMYSATDYNPAMASTSTLSRSSDPKTIDIRSWSKGFERMQDERLDKQRYVMSGNKSEEVSKLALGAKLERALGRRMTGQDAAFPVKSRQRQQERQQQDHRSKNDQDRDTTSSYQVEVR